MSAANQEIAQTIMGIIAHDAGATTIAEPNLKRDPSGRPVYKGKHFERIAAAAGVFFDKNPALLTDENIEEIAIGERSEVEEKYGVYEGFAALDKALNDWFDVL